MCRYTRPWIVELAMSPLRLSFAVLPLVCLALPVLAQEARGKVIQQPDWLERPKYEVLAEAYPKLAMALNIEGRATISCRVTAEGKVADCKVLSDSPTGLGFGEAALSLTPTFKMIPKKVDGQSVDGGTVQIPLHFALPPSRPLTRGDTVGTEVFGPATPAAMDLARSIVRAQGMGARAQIEFELNLVKMSGAKQAGQDEKLRDDAISALRESYQNTQDRIQEVIAGAYAGAFTEAELKDIAAFMNSPSGHAFATRLPTIQDSVKPSILKVVQDMSMSAHDIYCRNHPCSAELPAPAAAPKP